MITNKKAQVTLFIIIGIVVLVTAGIFIYFRTTITKKEVVVGVMEIEAIPLELVPVRTFVEAAIDTTARKGLEKLTKHGGYIYLDSFIPNNLNPTEANNLEYVDGFKIPYWNYMESPNDCTNCLFDSRMPPLCKQGRNCIKNGENSIEEELEKYINNELENNLNNFAALKEQGFEITEEGIPKANVMIRDKDVVIYVDYPLKVKEESTSKVSQFQKIIKSELSEMYGMAYDIIDYEVENCLVEEQVRNYYSIFYGLEEGQLPPESKTTSGPGKIKIWTLNEVKNILKPKTADALRLQGVFNTSGFVWPRYTNVNDPYYDTRQGVLDQWVFYPVRSFHDATVTFTYNPWWEPYLSIKPEENDIIMPTQFGGAGGLAAIFSHLTSTNIYEFQYQYSFPVAVEIRKKDDKGIVHIFRFALEANIRGNRCLTEGTNIRQTATLFPSLTCSEAEKTKDLRIEVKDEATGKPVESVEVSFQANEKCVLGYTDQNGKLTTKYPDAYGGFIVLSKEDYLSKLISQDEFTNSLATTIKPIKEKKVIFRIIDDNTLKQMKAATSRTEALRIKEINLKLPNPNDRITVTIKREKESYQYPGFESTITFSEGTSQPETVRLVPGNYNISIQLYLTKDITIPKELDRVCADKPLDAKACNKKPKSPHCYETDFEKTENPECYLKGYECVGNALGKGCEVDEEIVHDEIDLTVIPNGGAEYNNWKIKSYNDLNKGENVIFYLFRQDIPTRHHHLNNLMKYQDYSKDFEYAIMPEVK